MSRRRTSGPGEPPPAPSAPALPSSRTLSALVVLGSASALWAAVLWRELLKVRAGLDSAVCPATGEGGCETLWDAPFAKAVESATGVPVAGWGVAWGLAAALAPRVAVVAHASRPALAQLWVTATRLVAAAGVLTVLALLGVSAAAGTLCRGCVLTYVLVAAYAGLALFAWRALGLPRLGPAAGLAVATAVVAVAAVRVLAPEPPPLLPEAPPAAAAAAPPAGASVAPAMGNPQLAAVIGALPPPAQQELADALFVFRTGPSAPLPPARRLEGPSSAPLRITTFSDFLCGHCATLHTVLDQLRERVPPGRIAVEPRHYPLDGRCNPEIRGQAKEDVRCVAARAAICLEPHPRADEFRGRLYAQQATLDAQAVVAAASSFMPARELQACMADMTTDRRLREDIALASRYHLDGTPLVVVNGRKGAAYPPFLLAMALTGGSADDPAFAYLPPPRPDAHVH